VARRLVVAIRNEHRPISGAAHGGTRSALAEATAAQIGETHPSNEITLAQEGD
jgi:hypothetical protein